MKRAVLAGLFIGLVACSDPTTTPTSTGDGGYHDVQATLGLCQASQQAVSEALQSSDIAVALRTLEAGRDSCRAAAAQLRKNPIPTLNSAEVADALDQMATGLDQIADGVRIMESSPTKARAKAQAGLAKYRKGVEGLTAANP